MQNSGKFNTNNYIIVDYLFLKLLSRCVLYGVNNGKKIGVYIFLLPISD